MTRLLEALGGRRFGVIYADPPWAFITHGGDKTTPHRTADDHYELLEFDQLAAIPVRMAAADDALLHMWTVSSHVDAALALGAVWGFTFKSVGFIWVKTTKAGQPKMSMGHWTRQQAEICLLFSRGQPKRVSKGVRQVIMEPPREHSRKPDSTRDRIMALSGGPYLELFARAEAPGWTSWGNQVGKFDHPA